jgi:hypothetical protein
LETRRALPVQALGCGCGRETSGEGSSAELGCTAAWSEDSTDSNILDEAGVDAGALEEGLVDAVEEVSRLSVFEATLSALGKSSAQRASYNNLSSISATYHR